VVSRADHWLDSIPGSAAAAMVLAVCCGEEAEQLRVDVVRLLPLESRGEVVILPVQADAEHPHAMAMQAALQLQTDELERGNGLVTARLAPQLTLACHAETSHTRNTAGRGGLSVSSTARLLAAAASRPLTSRGSLLLPLR
jgi:hypothetical protein